MAEEKTEKSPPHKGLGKGLSALIGENSGAVTMTNAGRIYYNPGGGAAPEPQALPSDSQYQSLPVQVIEGGRFQPRLQFEEENLQELADSIRQNGVVQPILVREKPEKTGAYEIVAGERRWRAARMAGLSNIPSILIKVDDKSAMEIGLVENIQRRDLSPIEVAQGYQRLIEEFGYTQEALSDVLGKSRPQVSNTLRLLSLPEKVKQLVLQNKISFGHARALAALESQKDIEKLASQIVKRDLSVRQTEKIIQQRKSPKPQRLRMPPQTSFIQKSRDPEIQRLEQLVSRNLGMEIFIDNSYPEKDSGRVIVEYRSMDELDRLLALLNVNEDEQIANIESFYKTPQQDSKPLEDELEDELEKYDQPQPTPGQQAPVFPFGGVVSTQSPEDPSGKEEDWIIMEDSEEQEFAKQWTNLPKKENQ